MRGDHNNTARSAPRPPQALSTERRVACPAAGSLRVHTVARARATRSQGRGPRSSHSARRSSTRPGASTHTDALPEQSTLCAASGRRSAADVMADAHLPRTARDAVTCLRPSRAVRRLRRPTSPPPRPPAIPFRPPFRASDPVSPPPALRPRHRRLFFGFYF